MPARALLPAQPPPTCDALASLGANLATAMVLVDYAAHGLATPTPWARAAARTLPADALACLRRLRAVLAHGTVLREFLLDRLPPDHPGHREWPALRAWLERLGPGEVAALVTDGILAGLAYYRVEMDPMPPVEALLERLGTREPDAARLADPGSRRAGLEALLLSWGARDPREPVELALDAERFHAELLTLLEAVWQALAPSWQAAAGRLEEAAAAARARCAHPLPAADRIVEVTGLQPPEALAPVLRSAGHLLFVPCLHLGGYLSITRRGLGWAPAGIGPDRLRVFFEPPAAAGAEAATGAGPGPAPTGAPPGAPAGSRPRAAARPAAGPQLIDLGHLAPALEALGDPTRLAIVRLLRREGECFAGRVAEALGLHPSTVSRHFARLEAAGLVRVRREGGVKHYRLDRERLRAVARLLEHELG